MSQPEFICIINDPDGAAVTAEDKLKAASGRFFLCLGATETSDIAGISAAGATPAMRRLTPAIDAEALIDGKTYSHPSLPVSPAGIASPVVITRACLGLAGVPETVVDCGTFASPAVASLRVGTAPARAVPTGRAMSLGLVKQLFQAGIEAGLQAAKSNEFIVVAECVPGGTTTAMGVLFALGWDVRSSLSSSVVECNHDGRFELVQLGLQNSGIEPANFADQPLLAVSAVGDPMQPFAAGLALAASQSIPVILGGGSQMLAVFALMKALRKANKQSTPLAQTPVVATTKWVAFDRNADTRALSKNIGAPYLAACPDFTNSRHPGLRFYEEGHVKEGAGAGAALFLAHALAGFSADEIQTAIDQTYSELIPDQSLVSNC